MVGTALGPFITGVVSDLLADKFHLGVQSLRYAIACSSVLALFGAWHFLQTARHLPTEIARREATASH